MQRNRAIAVLFSLCPEGQSAPDASNRRVNFVGTSCFSFGSNTEPFYPEVARVARLSSVVVFLSLLRLVDVPFLFTSSPQGSFPGSGNTRTRR